MSTCTNEGHDKLSINAGRKKMDRLERRNCRFFLPGRILESETVPDSVQQIISNMFWDTKVTTQVSLN